MSNFNVRSSFICEPVVHNIDRDDIAVRIPTTLTAPLHGGSILKATLTVPETEIPGNQDVYDGTQVFTAATEGDLAIFINEGFPTCDNGTINLPGGVNPAYQNYQFQPGSIHTAVRLSEHNRFRIAYGAIDPATVGNVAAGSFLIPADSNVGAPVTNLVVSATLTTRVGLVIEKVGFAPIGGQPGGLGFSPIVIARVVYNYSV